MTSITSSFNKILMYVGIVALVALPAFFMQVQQAEASGLTSTQIDAILGLLESFGADQSVIDDVAEALGGTYVPPETGDLIPLEPVFKSSKVEVIPTEVSDLGEIDEALFTLKFKLINYNDVPVNVDSIIRREPLPSNASGHFSYSIIKNGSLEGEAFIISHHLLSSESVPRQIQPGVEEEYTMVVHMRPRVSGFYNIELSELTWGADHVIGDSELGDFETNSVFLRGLNTLPEPKVTVRYPRSGDSFIAGTFSRIIYDVENFPRDTKVAIQLNKDATYPSGPFNPITSITNITSHNQTGTGYVNFDLPITLAGGSDYSFLVSIDYPSTESPQYNAYTDEFTIIASTSTTRGVTVIAPNGGETFVQGERNQIKWNLQGSASDSKYMSIGIATNPDVADDPSLGTGWIASYPVSGEGKDSYIWDGITVCDGHNGSTGVNCTKRLKPGTYKIHIGTWINGEYYMDWSDNSFVVKGAPVTEDGAVSVGLGEKGIWYKQRYATVSWNKDAFARDRVDVILCKGDTCWPSAMGVTNDGEQRLFMYANKPDGSDYYVKVRNERSPSTEQKSSTFTVKTYPADIKVDGRSNNTWGYGETHTAIWNRNAFDTSTVDVILCKKDLNCWPTALNTSNDGNHSFKMYSNKPAGDGYYVVVRKPNTPGSAQNSKTFSVGYIKSSHMLSDFMVASAYRAWGALYSEVRSGVIWALTR